jgi:hypothetical protein
MMMLSDLRKGRINPSLLSNSDLGSIYDRMEKTYQSPKVLHIYAQQSFGNGNAIPMDVWIKTFFQYPLNIENKLPKSNKYQYLLSTSSSIGKVERLIWVAAQARKVHSSACNDALWCIKKASGKEARGANPLACKICILRSTCPAYQKIKIKTITFNSTQNKADFLIKTSAANNKTPGQKFVSCTGNSVYGKITDDFSPSDAPTGFNTFPSPHHVKAATMTVEDFMNLY